MLHGIVDCFREADQHIRIEIGVDAQSGDQSLHEVFNFSNAAGVRRQF